MAFLNAFMSKLIKVFLGAFLGMPLLFEFHFQEIERKLKSDQILAEMGFEPGNSGPESRVLTTILWRNLIQNAQKVTWNPSANFGSNFLLL